nr:phosphoribosylglycinamide formyltransferase, chloroplastic-like [Oryza sativa Japonica Group]
MSSSTSLSTAPSAEYTETTESSPPHQSNRGRNIEYAPGLIPNGGGLSPPVIGYHAPKVSTLLQGAIREPTDVTKKRKTRSSAVSTLTLAPKKKAKSKKTKPTDDLPALDPSIEQALDEEDIEDDVDQATAEVSHGGAEHARCSGILVVVFPNSKSEPKGLSTNELLNTLRELRVDSILLASYSKLIPVELVQAYPRSIWNIHPSLLPAFGGKGYYGLKVHKAVVASRARYSGPTVHFVDEHYDIGRTLAQRVVSMLANDILEQLATRVLHEEHQVYVDVVTALCDDRIVWREDGVPIIRSRTNPDEYT